MFPQKGCLAPGSDADLVIFNPTQTHTLSAKTHHMNVDYSAYEGWEVTGKCETVIMRGSVAIDHGKVQIVKGYGRFVKRGRLSKVI